MNEKLSEKNYSFCTLALGNRYQVMAKELAADLECYGPGIMLVVGTDKPDEFSSLSNVIAFELHQQGILHCYHDKRFAIAQALSLFETTILIDADTRITDYLPEKIETTPGVIGCFNEDLLTHVQKYTPERLKTLQKIANKINVDLETTYFIGEALIIISRCQGKEQEFLDWWGKIGTYSELRGIYAGSGNIIGLAVAKTGLKVERTPDWSKIQEIKDHLDASHQKTKLNFWQQLQKRLSYHYRLNKTRLLALKEAEFYYR